MQTFLPYEDFFLSALSIDKKRCWKQVIEAKQIIDCLEGKTTAWQNHPAVKMWEGYVEPLKYYYNCFLFVSKENHGINTKREEYEVINKIFEEGNSGLLNWPWWLGNEDFHRAMRARLIEKDGDFYLPKFPKDKGFNNGLYWWPVNETKTFKIINNRKK